MDDFQALPQVPFQPDGYQEFQAKEDPPAFTKLNDNPVFRKLSDNPVFERHR